MPRPEVVVFLMRILLPSDSRGLSTSRQLSCGSEDLIVRRIPARLFPWAYRRQRRPKYLSSHCHLLKASKHFANIAETWRVRAGD
jgi:hypothetical protein